MLLYGVIKMRTAITLGLLFFSCLEYSCNGRGPISTDGEFKNDEFMSVEEVRTILKEKRSNGQHLIGYGRTVFEGTRIETFEVDFLDVVLFGGFVKRPIYLARLLATHPVVEKSGVSAGMSGSPIYVNGKLVGALAYGWAWQRERDQLIGITPIKFMLDDARGLDVPRIAQGIPRDATFTPLSIPVSVSGHRVKGLKDRRWYRKGKDLLAFPEFEIIPLSTQQSSKLSIYESPDKFEPGSLLGVQFVRGDMDYVGYGTVTYVKGDTVIGFGHPMFGAGEITVPMTSGVVHTVYAGLRSSYKVGAGGKLLGALIQDRDACVVGKVGTNWQQKVKMVPVRINIKNQKDNINEVISVDIVNHKMFFPDLLYEVAATSSMIFEPSWLRDRVIMFKADVNLVNGQKLHFENVYAEDEYGRALVGYPEDDMYYRLAVLLNNPWEKVDIESVSMTSEYINESQARYIKEAWPVENEVVDGGAAKMKLVLKRRYTPDEAREVTLQLPKGLKKNQEITIRVGGGAFMSLEIPPYSDLNGLVGAIQTEYNNKELIVETTVEGFNFMYKGKHLENIPLGMLAQLVPSLNEQSLLGNITIREKKLQDVIILGSATIRIRIK